jgi:putative SOS response-associated peptidase YedK
MADGSPYAFGGLWESWEGEKVQSTTIITTEANELVAEIHHRMPVVLPQASYDAWLDPQTRDPQEILPLLVAYPSEEMRAYPVSTHVNRPANDDQACVAPVSG